MDETPGFQIALQEPRDCPMRWDDGPESWGCRADWHRWSSFWSPADYRGRISWPGGGKYLRDVGQNEGRCGQHVNRFFALPPRKFSALAPHLPSTLAKDPLPWQPTPGKQPARAKAQPPAPTSRPRLRPTSHSPLTRGPPYHYPLSTAVTHALFAASLLGF